MAMYTLDHHVKETPRVLTKDDIERRGAILFLAEVTLMLSGLFLAIAPIGMHVLYFILAVALAVAVLQTARAAAKVIPASLPFQRPVGVALYLCAHTIQFSIPGQLPMALVAFVLIATPLAMMLLFH